MTKVSIKYQHFICLLPDCIVNMIKELVKIHVASSQLLLLVFDAVVVTVVASVGTVMLESIPVMLESNPVELQVMLINSSQEMFIAIHCSLVTDAMSVNSISVKS